MPGQSYTANTTGRLPAAAPFPQPVGRFNFTLSGGAGVSATVALQRRLSGETVWRTVSRDGSGVPAVFTVAANAVAFDGVLNEPEAGTDYSLDVVAISGGSISVRFGQ